MYTLKTIARRGTALGMAASMLVAVVMPAAAVFADALNPLTERSLLLSSSAPGWQSTDGSGNPTYAPPGSGPNGSKTGETFTFTVSSSDTVKGLSFQYCTAAAGLCRGPGNNNGDFRGEFDGPNPEDWDMVSDREVNEGPGGAHENQRSDLDIVGTFAQQTLPGAPVFSGQYEGVSPEEPNPADYDDGITDDDYLADMVLYNAYIAGIADVSAGNFQVFVDGVASGATDWTMDKRNAESITWANQPGEMGLTGKNNYMMLTSATGVALTAGQEVKVVFKASGTNYITNPGSDEFFVKINTYDTDDYADAVDTDGDDGDGSQGFSYLTPLDSNIHVIDGGVTVANVMTDSIHIVTKVLETMSFSVGIQNPDTVDREQTQGGDEVVEHGRCEPMLQTNTLTGLTNNRLNLGNPNAEYSLETGRAWDVYSYWRLSSNSSGGATVYYSGDTLANTSGDKIADMKTEQLSNPGTEQFGLGFVDAGTETFANTGDGNDIFQDGWNVRSYPFVTLFGQELNPPYDALASQTASSGYDEASGRINVDGLDPIEAKFQFHATSNTIPRMIAQQKETVISCATAKMRYVGNIGADTPAGVYTTKINYLAAPQY